jgi:putative membrane protein
LRLGLTKSSSILRRPGAPIAQEARTGSWIIKKTLIVAGVFGLLLVVFLIVHSGAADVGRAMLVLGWSLAPITLFRLVPMSFDALSWRQLLPVSSRPNVFGVVWMRWIRESINALLPVAGVGGDIAGARLVHQRGVPGARAAAAMVVDITIGAATQLIFVLAGVTLLAVRSSAHAAVPVVWAMLTGIAVFVAAIATFVLVQHNNVFLVLAKLARRVAPEKWLADLTGGASEVDEAVAAAYRRGFVLSRASLLRLVAWAAGAGEIWLVTHFLGRAFSLTDAFMLESLGSGVEMAAFMAPGALGAREGAFILFGALFGLPANIALAISLAKRVRELALGLPGLVVWQCVEGRHLMRRAPLFRRERRRG